MGARPTRRSSSLFESGYEELVRALVDARKHAGLTQEELARRMGRHRSFIWKVEGRQRRVDLIEFVQWLRSCGSDPLPAFESLLPSIAGPRGGGRSRSRSRGNKARAGM